MTWYRQKYAGTAHRIYDWKWALNPRAKEPWAISTTIHTDGKALCLHVINLLRTKHWSIALLPTTIENNYDSNSLRYSTVLLFPPSFIFCYLQRETRASGLTTVNRKKLISLTHWFQSFKVACVATGGRNHSCCAIPQWWDHCSLEHKLKSCL